MYVGQFKDINENLYSVIISPKSSATERIEIILSDNPVTITQNSDNIFKEIKPLSCTIEIISNIIYPDMYAVDAKDVSVVVRCETTNTILFDGYLTPYIYNQPYAHSLDTIQLEAVSKLSVLKEFDYFPVDEKAEIVSFTDIIWHILATGAGYDSRKLEILYHLPCFTIDQDRPLRLSELFISEANFFDNDDERTPWTMEDVLTEICRYLGLTCTEYNGTIYFIDYQYLCCHSEVGVFKMNVINSKNYGDVSLTKSIGKITKNIDINDYASDDSNISYDDIYNKLNVNINMYDIEELAPDILDLKNTENISGYPNQTTWTRTTGKRKKKKTYDTYYELQTFKIIDASTRWKHRYYKMSDGTELSSYFDKNSSSQYNTNVSPRINTRCAVIERYSGYSAEAVIPPTSLDWEECIAFFCLDDTTTNPGSSIPGVINMAMCEDLLEQPVLEYVSDEPIFFSPVKGSSYITFKGDLFYQKNVTQEVDDVDLTTYIINQNKKYFVTQPVYDDKEGVEPYPFIAHIDHSDTRIVRAPHRTSSDPNYGKGWPMIKCKLQIGDKYWNGTQWTTTESTFYINYNNKPENGDTERQYIFEWLSPVSNFDYTTNIGEDCWIIPIKPTDNISGRLHFTLYTPSQMRSTFFNENGVGSTYAFWWDDLVPVIYMKGFELSYVYCDTTPWYLNGENEEKDIVYTNEFPTNYERIADDIECKINTNPKEVPVSKSFVGTIGANNSINFLDNVTSLSTGTTQIFENLMIEKFLNHYANKKLVYETSLFYDVDSSNINPFNRYSFIFNQEPINTFKNDNNTSKYFIMDSYTLDVKRGVSNTKFIEW